MSLQSQIQQIINERKSRAEKIQIEIDNINKLTSNLEDVKKRIQNLNLENSSEYVRKIQTKLQELEKAKIQALHLRERFERDTINIGVAGFTHSGKSTFLQTVSGLDDNSIPKADDNDKNSGKPTTATRSQIYNSSNRYADIYFRSETEFLEYVNNYVESLGLPKADSLSSFKDINFDTVDVENLKTDRHLVKIDIERIKGIQEALPYFENNLQNNGSVKVNGEKFNELKQYVAYSYEDAKKRLYPAVREAKIYSPFAGIDPDLQIGLIDLPGFGEHENVTKKTLDDIKNDVDSVIILYRPGLANYELLDNEKEKFKDVLNSQQAITNKTDFISFLINKDTRVPDNYIQKSVSGIQNVWPNFKVRVASSNNVKEVEVELSSIINDLAGSLAQMDQDLIDAYLKDRDLSEMEKMVTGILSFISQAETQNEEAFIFAEKGKTFRQDFGHALENLLKEYQKSDADEDFEQKVNSIKNSIDERLKEDLFFVPGVRTSWEEYIKMVQHGALESTLGAELRRIWTCIINEYVQLNEVFKENLSFLKKEIIKIFASLTGDLVENKDADNFEEIIEKLNLLGSENQIYKAFTSIDALRQDFRQNLYPCVFKNKINNLMEVHDSLTPEGVVEYSREEISINSYKEKLINISKSANYEISKTIKSNYVSAFFLIGVLHTFNENIIYSKTENDLDFVKFCSLFKKKIYPNEFGSEADSVKFVELKNCLEETKSLINLF